jgi:hypothetical protein
MCEHENFTSNVNVIQLTDVPDGPVTSHVAEVSIRCAECGKFFRFIGMPFGIAGDGPARSFNGTEARLPIEPMDKGMS